MSDGLHYAISAVTIVGWTPMLARFWSAWRRRRNPVSIAIFALVVLHVLFFCLAPFWVIPGGDAVTADVVRAMMAVQATLGLAVCLGFHVAFHFAKLFHDGRDDEAMRLPTPVETPSGLLVKRARAVLARHGCQSCGDCTALHPLLGGRA